MGQQINMNVQLKPEDQRKCKCGSSVFVPTVAMFDVSAIMSPNGQASVFVADAGFICANCGTPAGMEPKVDGSPKIALVGGN
jgi:hypothetical protein